MDISEIAEVIDEDGGSKISCKCGFSSVSRNESCGRTDQLIDTHDLPRTGCGFFPFLLPFRSPWFPMGFAIGASWTGDLRWQVLLESIRLVPFTAILETEDGRISREGRKVDVVFV